MRSYSLLHGPEISSGFVQAGDFGILILSFFTQQPSDEHVELLEPRAVHSLTYHQRQQLYHDFPSSMASAGS